MIILPWGGMAYTTGHGAPQAVQSCSINFFILAAWPQKSWALLAQKKKTYLVNQMLQRNLFETHFDKILLIYENPQSMHDFRLN